MDNSSLNRIQPKNPDRKKKVAALSLATCVLMGIVGYEVLREKEKIQPIIHELIIPPLSSQNDQLQIELNRSTNKLNELKRLLFVRNHAPESAVVRDLKTSLYEKEQHLDQLKQTIARFEEEISQERLRSATMETSMIALADAIEIQKASKERLQDTLTQTVADARQEALEQTHLLSLQLEQLLVDRNEEVETLKAQIDQEKLQMHDLMVALDNERMRILNDFQDTQQAYAEVEESWKKNVFELKEQLAEAQASILEKDLQVIISDSQVVELAASLETLQNRLADKERGLADLQNALESSYLQQAQLADEVTIQRAFSRIISTNLDAKTQMSLFDLKNHIELLQAELQVARATLEQEKRAKESLNSNFADLVSKTALMESELVLSHQALLSSSFGESIVKETLAAHGADLEDEIALHKAISKIEKVIIHKDADNKRAQLKNEWESQLAALQNELDNSRLQVEMQQDRERVLNNTLASLEKNISELQNEISQNEANTQHLMELSAEELVDLQEKILFERLTHQIKVETISSELEELARALQVTEKQRNLLKEELEQRLAALSEKSDGDVNQIAHLTDELQKEKQEKINLLSQVASLMEVQENEKLNSGNLRDELENSHLVQAQLTEELENQAKQLKAVKAEWEEYAQSYTADKLQLEQQINILKEISETEKSRSEEAKKHLEIVKGAHDQAANRTLTLEAVIAEKDQERELVVADLQKDCASLQAELSQEKQQHRAIEQELQKALANFDAALHMVNELKGSLKEKELALLDKETNQTLSISTQAELSVEIESLQAKLREEDARALSLKNELENISIKKEEAEQLAASLEKKLAATQAELEIKLANTQAELEEKLVLAEKSQHEEKEKLLAEVQHLESRYKEELAVANLRTQTIEQDISSIRDAKESEEKRAQQLEVSLAKTEETLHAVQGYLEELQAELTAKEANLNQQVASRNALSSQLEDLNQSLNTRIQKSETLEQNLAGIQLKYEETLQLVQNLQEQLEKKHEEVEITRSDADTTHSQLKNEINALRTSLEKEQERANAFSSQASALQSQYEATSQRILEIQANQQQLETERTPEDLHAKIAEIQKENETIRNNYHTLSTYLHDQRESLDTMKRHRDDLMSEIEKIKSETAR